MQARLLGRHPGLRAAQREERFHKIQAAFQRHRQSAAAGKPRDTILVAKGGPIDPSLIEDREYELEELVGLDSRFRFRLIPWAGA
jgi:predicted TIM-barrel enzyme